ncbi:response regulator [Lutispora sp.]|uniref:response regulator n=1 Tax=Lutispora sp. TaxID=2828727 RepID=UPI0035677768
MIKVIIADDEALEREVYKVLIRRHFPELKVVAEVETGRKAIEAFEIHKPELMLMDVKMPGINGIEAIEEIRKRNSNSKFIVVSAYNYFDYAKEALKLGIEDYLLKPVAKDEFINVIGGVLQKIKLEKRSNKEELEIKERLRSILPVLEIETALAVMMGDDDRIRRYASLLDVDISSGYIAIGMINEESLAINDEMERGLMTEKIQVYIKDNMPELKPCLISSFIANKIVLVFSLQGDEQDYDIRDSAFKKMLRIRNAVKDNFKVKMCFGISEAHSSLGEIRHSYNQALTVINNIDSFGSDIVNYGDIKGEIVKQFHYPYEMEKQLLEKIRLGITEHAIRVFVGIFDYTTETLECNVNRVKFELLQLYFALTRLIYEAGNEKSGLRDFITGKDRYYSLKTLEEIYHTFEEDIRLISDRFREERTKRAKGILFLAVRYINENYMRELTLEEVAKQVCVSPNYFSRMFKNEYSKSFIDYLTHIRIEEAKKLILKSGRNISDICWEVGYSDPNYFTKVFKKVTGLTPSEFKDIKLVK